MRAHDPALALPRRFELLRHLGSGGMGAVYEALDHERGARVALKTLWSARPEALLHLKNEFRALQDVRHPNLVHLLELVEANGRFFVLMELVLGESFLAHVRPGAHEPSLSGLSETRDVQPRSHLPAPALELDEAPLSGLLQEPRLRAALTQLAEGLCALHDRGKVHRDIKPANVLVTDTGRVVLVDFGLAHDLGGTQLGAGGTRAFMAPEQAAGQSLTSAADWFSVGVMLYLALSGQLPFQGAELERKKLAQRPRLDAAALALPADLVSITLDLLDPNPTRRPDARRLLARLGRAERVPALYTATPFHGREQELTRLSRAFDASTQAARAVLVLGDSGLGKSTLARHWLASLGQKEASTLVLSGRCYERELVPYKAFDGIIDALSQFLLQVSPTELASLLPEDAWILARIFPVLGRVPVLAAPHALEQAQPQELRSRAFAALRELLARLAGQRRLVLFIDDLQWADSDSHALLAELLQQPGAPRLTLLATARPPRSDSEPLATLASRLPGVSELPLLPLDFEAARALAGSVLGSAQTELASALALETGGHPLLLQTLAEHARQAGGARVENVRLDDALWAHVQRVEPRARLLLELIALSAAPLRSALAQQAAELEQSTFDAHLASLRVQRLVRTSTADPRERVEPYHDRIRETVLGHLTNEQKRRHHDRLASAMQATALEPADARVLVLHLREAGRRAEAAEQAERAATHAASALAFDQAAELYQIALELSSDAGRESLSVGLAEALANAGRAAAAAAAYLQAADRAPRERRLDYRRRAADHMLRSGHLEQGTAILSDVLRDSGDRLTSQRRSLATTLWQRFLLERRGLGWQPTPAAEVPSEQLHRIDAYHAVGISFALIDPIRGSAFQARAVRLALDAGEPLRLGPVLLMEAGYQASAGGAGLAKARRLLAEVAQIAQQTGNAYVGATQRMMQGFIDYHAGDFVAAASLLTEMELAFRKLTGTYFEQAFCHCFRLICVRNQGLYGELWRGFAGYVREAERRGDRFTEASLRFNLNGVWLAQDDPEEALRDLARVSWIPPQGGYHVQHWYEQQARNEIDLYAGRARAGLERMRGEMKALSRSFILRLRLHRALARWQLGRLLLANATEQSSPGGLLREARKLEQQLLGEDVGFARAWGLLLGAGREHLLGRDEQALATLEQAHACARQHGLQHCQHAAGLSLGRMLGGPREAELTEQALAWAKAQQIVAPTRWFASLSPGLAPRGAAALGAAG